MKPVPELPKMSNPIGDRGDWVDRCAVLEERLRMALGIIAYLDDCDPWFLDKSGDRETVAALSVGLTPDGVG